MITKQQIETCNDGQQLAEWAAVYCMGWTYVNMMVETAHWVDSADKIIHLHYEWQPHQPTEKGKAQAIDLALKYEMALDFEDLEICLKVRPNEQHYRWESVFFGCREKPEISWQIAVLKAALLSSINSDNANS